MRAAWYERTGRARDVLVHGRRPRPSAKDGEVLVRVAYSAVHPADVKRRAGLLGLPPAGPVIPHSDGAGVVEAVGDGLPAGAWLHRPVWIFHAQRGRAEGTAAEYVALPARLCRPAPEPFTLAEAACIGIPMLTAHAAVLGQGPVEGKSVVVTGAAGGVGRYALQWARWAGASRVLGTVTAASQKGLARDLGADAVLDLGEREPQAWIEDALGGARKVDLVVDLDMGRNAPWVQKVVAPGGRWSIYASSAPVALDPRALLDTNARLRFVQSHSLAPHELAAALADVARIHADRAVRHEIGEVFALEDIAAAHERVEARGRRGATLLRVGEAA